MTSREPSGTGARLLREPLLHFVALGALIFAAHGALGDAPGADDAGRGPIVVSERFVEGLAAEHARRTGREPDAATVEALVEDFVREEALHREGRRRGLARGDAIVRRRIIQKMEFLLRATVEDPEPTEAALEAYLDAHAERFRRPARVGFVHVFFGRDRRERAEADARAALAELRARGAGPGDAAGRGDPFVLGARIGARPLERIAGDFGRGFAGALEDVEAGGWAGPLESAFGWHLVHVTEREAGGPATLAEVRERVRAAWLEEQRERRYREAVQALVDAYGVERTAEPTEASGRGADPMAATGP